MDSWIGNLISAIGGAAVVFILRLFWDKRQEKKREQQEKLETHFYTINEEVIDKLYHMSNSLAIEHNELIFRSSMKEIIPYDLSGEEIYLSKEPVLAHYKFEEDDNYLSFEVHFPERAQEWKQLKSEALIIKDYCNILSRGTSSNNKAEYDDAKRKIGNDFFPLQKKFKDFAQRLSSDVETIGKYQIGKTFKYSKKCPICKKF